MGKALNNIIKRGSIPTYALTGSTLILSLVGFIFIQTTSALKEEIKETTGKVDSTISRTTAVETDIKNIKDSQLRIEKKLDSVILNVKY